MHGQQILIVIIPFSNLRVTSDRTYFQTKNLESFPSKTLCSNHLGGQHLSAKTAGRKKKRGG
jgi:hypothetical protein